MLCDFVIGCLFGVWLYLSLSVVGATCINAIRTRVNRERSVAAEVAGRCSVEPEARSGGFLSRGIAAQQRRYILRRILS